MVDYYNGYRRLLLTLNTIFQDYNLTTEEITSVVFSNPDIFIPKRIKLKGGVVKEIIIRVAYFSALALFMSGSKEINHEMIRSFFDLTEKRIDKVMSDIKNKQDKMVIK